MMKWRSVCTWAQVLTLLLCMEPGTAAAATIHVGSGGNLQAALDAAQPGDTILLEPGAVYVGSFVIKSAVTLRTNIALPAGRITPDWSGRLAVLQSPTNQAALRLAPGVSHVRIAGIEVAPNGHSDGTSIEIGSPVGTDAMLQPRNVVVDRVLARGHPINGQKRGLSLHGSDITVTRSHISDMKLAGQDTQAIYINNGWGPYSIRDNYLEASGENIMAGGDTPRIDQLVPADILIEGNHIAKPLAWKKESWTVKNLLELKTGRRVTIRGNLLEGSWVSGQVGYGILLTPKDQYGRAPWTTVQDVVVERNVIRDVSEAIRVLGDDHAQPNVRAARITIRRNLLVVDAEAHGGSGRCLTVGRAPQQIEFSFNTCIANGPMAIYTYRGGDVQTIMGGVFRSNAFLHNLYGFSGDDATSGGVLALAPHYPDLVFVDNLIGGGTASRYPVNYVLSVAEFKAQFVDYAGGDFRIKETSQYRSAGAQGTGVGVNLTAMQAAPVMGRPNQPPMVTLAAPAAPVYVGSTVTLAAEAADPDGQVTRVEFYAGSTLLASVSRPPYSAQWLVPSPGTYSVRAIAIDSDGAQASSAPVTIVPQSEIVLHASQVSRMTGDFVLVADTTAAGGQRVANPNHDRPKVSKAVASPASYAEFTFHAEAGRPYKLWVRGSAERDNRANDSIYVQFSGVAGMRIGTTEARSVILEEATSAVISGWGWRDDAYGAVALPVVFEQTGRQVIRLQPREDGLSIDQIVLSPADYLTVAPGALRNDTTIVPR